MLLPKSSFSFRHSCNDAAAKTAAREPRAESALLDRRFNQGINARHGDLKIVPHRAMAFIHQLTQLSVIAVLQGLGSSQHALILGDAVTRSPAQRVIKASSPLDRLRRQMANIIRTKIGFG